MPTDMKFTLPVRVAATAVTPSLLASVLYTDLELLTCCQPWCTYSSYCI